MVKRKVGERAEILFDSIDLEILELLRSNEEGLQVLELADKLKIKHNSLKPHVDKLLHLNLISVMSIEKEKGNKEIRLVSPLSFYEDSIYSHSLTEEEEKKIGGLLTLFNNAIGLLRKARGYYWNKESIKLLDYDLRTKKSRDKAIKIKS